MRPDRSLLDEGLADGVEHAAARGPWRGNADELQAAGVVAHRRRRRHARARSPAAGARRTSMTAAGTRNPRSSTSRWASGCPRCASATSHDGVAQGVVPWAMSPSTVADAGRASASDGAQLHRGEVLRLVEDDVTQARRAPQTSASSSSEHDVGRGPPRGGARPGGGVPQQQLLLVVVEDPARAGDEELDVREEPEQHGARLERRPDRVRVAPHLPAAGHGVLHAVVGGVAGLLHEHENRVGKALGSMSRAAA